MYGILALHRTSLFSIDAIGNLESEKDLEALIDTLTGALVGDQVGQIGNGDEKDGELIGNEKRKIVRQGTETAL